MNLYIEKTIEYFQTFKWDNEYKINRINGFQR